jgi:hypothetical protein
LFVARASGISMKAAVITQFVLFTFVYQIVEFACLDYGAALQHEALPPLWRLMVAFPNQVIGGLYFASIKLVLDFPGSFIVMLILAGVAAMPTAAFGRVIWQSAR